MSNTMEEDFELLVKDVTKQIDEKLELASKYLAEAVELSEKHGVPFRAHISPLSQNYTPGTFREKHGDIDSTFVSDITGTWDENGYSYGGWQFSAVCW